MKLKKDYDNKFQQAATSYLEKNVRSLKEDNPGQAYRSLKKLGAQPGDCSEQGSFSLSYHSDLSTQESTDRIAQHFARISQEFLPLNIDLLPEDVQSKLRNKKEMKFPGCLS